LVKTAICPAIIEPNVATFASTEFFQTSTKRAELGLLCKIAFSRIHQHADLPDTISLLRAAKSLPRR
jgi:hypothetical protein